MTPYYEEKGITIYHGDCREILPMLEPVDLVLTDPPYGINTRSDGTGKLSPWADLCNAAFWYTDWIKSCRGILRHSGAMWTFLNWRSMVTFQKASCDAAWPIESCLIWNKEWIGPGGPRGLRPSYEMVLLFTMPSFAIPNRGIPDIKASPWSSTKPNGHPAEKPGDLCEWIISISGLPESGIVLDPFMGSGTTLRAAKDLGLRAIGIEIEEKYCEIAAERLRQNVFDFEGVA